MTALALVLPGDPATPTGGYEYDRRIVAGLRALGWTVTVHALDASFPMPTPAARAAARAVFARMPDGATVLVDGLAFGALPEIAAAEGQRLRLVALVHHPLAEETGLEPARAAALRRSEADALAGARRVVATSGSTARALAAYGVSPERIAVVEPGTDPALLAVGSGGPGLALLCVAAVVPRKGHAVLVDALSGLADRDWTLTCVGALDRSPATVAALRRQIGAHDLTHRVTLRDPVDRATLDALYARSDALVLPTFHEGYGMALAEALARGLPVVSTRAGAVPETVPADAGMLVPPGDTAALRDALACLIDDRALRDRLAAGARRARARLPDWNAACVRLAGALTTTPAHLERLHG
jgi:glycosyltransferase involved in cell wall biosynthesis